MIDFFEFLNRKNNNKLNHNNFSAPKLNEPKDFSIPKTTSSSKRLIKPFIGGLAGRSFRDRSIAKKLSDFQPRSGSSFKKF